MRLLAVLLPRLTARAHGTSTTMNVLFGLSAIQIFVLNDWGGCAPMEVQ